MKCMNKKIVEFRGSQVAICPDGIRKVPTTEATATADRGGCDGGGNDADALERECGESVVSRVLDRCFWGKTTRP